MRLRGVLGVVLLLGGGCRNSTDPGPAPVPAQTEPAQPAAPVNMPSLKIVADDPRMLSGPGSTLFKVMTINNLNVRLQTPSLAPNVTWVTLNIYAPAGGLYQTQHLVYSTDPTVKQAPAKFGSDHPFDVLPAVKIEDGFGLDSVVLVGGTNFQRRPIPGLWKFSAALDDKPEIHAELMVELSTVMQ